MTVARPLVVLFGYDCFVLVPSMMPRPILLDNFGLTYRKIPVLTIGRELYVDTSLIFEAIQACHAYPPSKSHPSLYQDARARTLTRILSSHYTDRSLFRLTTGLIPQIVWQTVFGTDRAGLIGHKLDAQKLGEKTPRNLSALDTYLSILEPLFANPGDWLLATMLPSGADICLYYQLDWGEKISRGEGIHDLTGGNAPDGIGEGMKTVFNKSRYPKLLGWFESMRQYVDALPQVETRIEKADTESVQNLMEKLNQAPFYEESPLIDTAANNLAELDQQIGLNIGSRVSVAPDDTGRSNPTIGTLLGMSNEEIVITPDLLAGKPPRVANIRVHFPKVGFVVKPLAIPSQAEQNTNSGDLKAKL